MTERDRVIPSNCIASDKHILGVPLMEFVRDAEYISSRPMINKHYKVAYWHNRMVGRDLLQSSID